MASALEKIKSMKDDAAIKASCDQRGLAIKEVSWDDCARTKGSVWGPCISDVTLRVERTNMPVIRAPNFTDVTWDLPLSQIKLVVGNQDVSGGSTTQVVTLQEYLRNLDKYLSYPGRWKNGPASLLKNREEEEHAVVSAQSCFLPMDDAVRDGSVSFNPCVYTYGSAERHPKVLYIVATCHGTSAQFKESSEKDSSARGSLLYVNNRGQRASLTGMRLEDDRRARGVSESGSMSKEEAAQNLVMLIQVPLQGPQEVFRSSFSFGAPKGLGGDGYRSRGLVSRGAPSMSHAIVRVGDSEGSYAELDNKELRRDTRYPVRVTMQYYKITNGAITDDHVDQVSKQIHAAMGKGVAFGSLVLQTNSGRQTEHMMAIDEDSTATPPAWWEMYWATFHEMYAVTKEQAARHFFGPHSSIPAHLGMEQCLPHMRERGASIIKKDRAAPPASAIFSADYGMV